MSAKENKAAIYKVFEEVTNGNLDIIDVYFANNFIRRAADGTETGRDTYKQICGFLLKTFRDFRITVDDIVAEGDRVAFRFTWSGTAPGAGGKHIAVTEDYFCRFKNGKIIEFNNLLDQLPGYQAQLETNKALVRYLYEKANQGDMETFFQHYAPGFIEHLTTGDMTLEQAKQLHARTDVDVVSVTFNHLVAEGDYVAVMSTWKMREKNTGKENEMTNAHTIKIKKGKLMEAWSVIDVRTAQLPPPRLD